MRLSIPAYVKTVDMSFFYHASCSTSYQLPPSSPKHPRACAMFWMTAYRNCPPLCFAVTNRNLTLQFSSFFSLFNLLLLILGSFLPSIVSLLSIFFPPINFRIYVLRSRIIGYINPFNKKFLFIDRKI